jgi:histone deacetylase complex regulatory component SIN3
MACDHVHSERSQQELERLQRAGRVCVNDLSCGLQVAFLFRDHDDLLEEFTYFLPDSQAPHRAAMERQRLAAQQREHETSSRRRQLRTEGGMQPVSLLSSPLASLPGHQNAMANTTELYLNAHAHTIAVTSSLARLLRSTFMVMCSMTSSEIAPPCLKRSGAGLQTALGMTS